MRTLKSVAVLLVVFFAFPTIALPNGAPVRGDPHGMGDFVVNQNSGIALIREDLVISVDESLGYAQVNVKYELKSTTGQPVKTTIAFPVSTSNVTVKFDGATLPVRAADQVATAGFSKQFMPEEIPLVDPVTSGEFGRTKTARGQLVLFDISIDDEQPHDLTVSYRHLSGWNDSPRVNRIHTFYYLLRPAASWSSSGTISIVVDVPSNVYFSSVPALKQASDARPPRDERSVFSAQLAGKPQTDLSFSVMSRKGTLLGTDKPPYSSVQFWVPCFFAVLLSWYAVRLVRTKSHWVGPILAALLALFSGFFAAVAGLIAVNTALPVDYFRRSSALYVALLLPAFGGVAGLVSGMVSYLVRRRRATKHALGRR